MTLIKKIILPLFFVIFANTFAQNRIISFQKANLYEDDSQQEVPSLNGFTALDLFHDDIDNSIWVSPEKQCVTMEVYKELSHDGKVSLHLTWDKPNGGCKWIGMGFGWNAWEPKELSLVAEFGAIQFYVRSFKDTLKSLPWAIALEDYSGVQAYTGFSPAYLESPITSDKWTRVNIPIKRFPIKAFDLDLTLIKQFIIQFDGEGEVLIDNFSIVGVPPIQEPTIQVIEINKASGMIESPQEEIAQFNGAKKVGMSTQVPQQQNLTKETQDAEINAKIDAILKNMTIEEKAGQMTQLDLGVISVGEIYQIQEPHRLDEAKLKKAIIDYKVGSILNCGGGKGTLEIEQWRKFITQIQEEAAKTRAKIPVLYGVDAVHGVNYTIGGTLFPQQLGQAATWNPELVEKGARVTAYECRASFIPWNFSPILDIARQPLWSRFFETYGEDNYLAKTIGKATVMGYQGKDLKSPYSVAACGKHFLGYSVPLSGKDRTPAYLSPRDLREYFVPTFEEAIKSGLKSVMINSGEISGSPVTADYDILTTLLRNELKFEGIAVTDWGDIEYLHTRHLVAPTMRDAVKMAIMAGVDMSMVPNNFDFTDLLIDLVKKGEIPESRLDLSVRRILKVKMELGLFENPVPKASDYPDFGSPKFAELSYQSASESITLLKNENKTLPLSANKKVFVCGAAANSLNLLNGAWTHTWQGIDTIFNSKGKKTIKEALENRLGKENVLFAKGASLTETVDLQACVESAKAVDYIVVCLGELPSTEVPGNIEDLNLPQAQVELIKELAKLKKPLVLVTLFNRPWIIREIVGNSDAILAAYLPGDMGGEAIADILIGKVNPSGKLPFTYPSAAGNIMHYDHKYTEAQDTKFGTNGYTPQFDFGTGLSYTTFEYSDLKANKTTFSQKDSFVLSVKVKNTGAMKGKEVVQVYYKDCFATITPAVKKLCRYQKIELAAGEEKTLSFTFSAKDFSFVAKNLKRITEAGDFELKVGSLMQKVTLKD
ncbi:MAG: glycoside hydrolase family 3 N-terminal domain-containing protein [Bacteroidia bacterium]